MLFVITGSVTLRSNAEYGNTRSTVGPPDFWFDSVMVMLGFSCRRFACVLAFRR